MDSGLNSHWKLGAKKCKWEMKNQCGQNPTLLKPVSWTKKVQGKNGETQLIPVQTATVVTRKTPTHSIRHDAKQEGGMTDGWGPSGNGGWLHSLYGRAERLWG